jgi:hypothetical protein
MSSFSLMLGRVFEESYRHGPVEAFSAWRSAGWRGCNHDAFPPRCRRRIRRTPQSTSARPAMHLASAGYASGMLGSFRGTGCEGGVQRIDERLKQPNRCLALVLGVEEVVVLPSDGKESEDYRSGRGSEGKQGQSWSATRARTKLRKFSARPSREHGMRWVRGSPSAPGPVRRCGTPREDESIKDVCFWF